MPTRDEIAYALWASYWPEQSEQWIREHWAVNWCDCQRPEFIRADVVLELLRKEESPCELP